MFGLRASVMKSAIIVPTMFSQQTRNTFILRRRWPPPLHKKGGKVPKMKGRHFVYDLVEDTSVKKKPDIRIVLNQFVEGVGTTGDVLTLHLNKAYENFILPGLAVYANPENLEKYKTYEKRPLEENTHSSPFVKRTMDCLHRLVLRVTMSNSEPWTLQPWHLKASLRKSGFVVPESAIEMPPVQIKGPDPNLLDKEFYVTVTINKKEKVHVRCRIYHWAAGQEQLPFEESYWKKPKQPLIPEQAEVLQKFPYQNE